MFFCQNNKFFLFIVFNNPSTSIIENSDSVQALQINPEENSK